VKIASGFDFNLALKSDGTVMSWGNNSNGQLGDGTSGSSKFIPVQVSGLGAGSGVVAIAAGGSHTPGTIGRLAVEVAAGIRALRPLFLSSKVRSPG
jgi:hypothetical protein